jgi:molecular chaperone GrpE
MKENENKSSEIENEQDEPVEETNSEVDEASAIEEANKRAYDAEAKCAETSDKYLRILAEYDNFRKRSAAEKERTYTDAKTDALGQILPVIDNLERAATYGGGNAENVAKGLEMTLRSFGEVMERLGVKEIEALGKTFDPELHNAVFHVDDESYGEQEIVEVLQKGYIIGDKVLRYAMVKVAN